MLLFAAVALLTGFSFAAFDGLEAFLPGAGVYLSATGLCFLLAILIGWRHREEDFPRWLIPALLGALVLRLLLALLLYRGLPILGYDTNIQNAGYVFADAFARDGDAWELVASGQSIAEILRQGGGNDQYGGLLIFSALFYKLVSPAMHRPLSIAIFAAFFSTLSIYFSWRFTYSIFGKRAAGAAFLVMALYPDAILLGASQMREPFLMAGLATAFFGYTRFREGGWAPALLPLLGGVLLLIPFSPPMAVLGLLVLGGVWVLDPRHHGRLPRWALIGGVFVVAALMYVTVKAWSSISGSPNSNPFQLAWWWLTEGARYQMVILEQRSGVVQAMFDYTPEWSHAILATVYGLVQPFFPAAVMDTTSPPIWRVISIWRAAGWFLLLPGLLYAPLAALRSKGWRHLAFYFAVVGWLLAAFVSYRAAGDQWDNPRYRATFLLVYAVVTGWSWAWARDTGTRWLRHTAAVVAGITVLFLQWYAGRYLYWPSLELFPTLALVVLFVPGYLVLAWLWERRQMRQG